MTTDLQMILDGLEVDSLSELKRLVDLGREVDELAASTLREAGVDPATLGPLSGRRDATMVELADEPDGVLQSIADGDLSATETTRRLARSELIFRSERAERRAR